MIGVRKKVSLQTGLIQSEGADELTVPCEGEKTFVVDPVNPCQDFADLDRGHPFRNGYLMQEGFSLFKVVEDLNGGEPGRDHELPGLETCCRAGYTGQDEKADIIPD